MGQFQNVPGPSQDEFNAQKQAIANLSNTVTKKHKRKDIGSLQNPAQSTYVSLNTPVTNYEYVQIFFRKQGTTGEFVSTIISTDDLSIGSYESISFSAYNSSSYNFYAECGFSTETKFNIATYHCTGWTMSSVWVIGIGEK